MTKNKKNKEQEIELDQKWTKKNNKKINKMSKKYPNNDKIHKKIDIYIFHKK